MSERKRKKRDGQKKKKRKGKRKNGTREKMERCNKNIIGKRQQ